MGDEYDEGYASVQACSSQVIQPICREYNTPDNWLVGEPQLIDLPFPYIEGDYTPHWANWSTKGMARVSNHIPDKCHLQAHQCGGLVGEG